MKKIIIVLSRQRTGSSLLMQTLRHLNVGIIGEFERRDLPQEANPNGYYEDVDILSKGLTENAIEKIEKNKSEIVAVKIAINGMIKNDRLEHWQYLQQKQATILVTIRPPLESAVSSLVFNNNANEFIHFKQITTQLCNYCLHYKALSEILVSKVPDLLPNIFLINYHMALKKTPEYVQRIVEKTRLVVTKSQFQDALENIDPSLYRYNQDMFEDNYKNWSRIIGADQIYNILLTSKNPWKAINDFKSKRWIPKSEDGALK